MLVLLRCRRFGWIAESFAVFQTFEPVDEDRKDIIVETFMDVFSHLLDNFIRNYKKHFQSFF